MIGKKIEDKVEDVIINAVENDVANITPAVDPEVNQKIIEEETGAQDDSLLAERQGDSMLPPQPELTELAQSGQEPPAVDTENMEPVQVAGKGTLLKGLLESVTERAAEAERKASMVSPEPKPVETIGDRVVIAPEQFETPDVIEERIGGEYTTGLNFPEIYTVNGEFDVANYLAKLKDSNQELFEQARRGTISFEEMLEMAERRGLNDVVTQIIERQPGEAFPPEDFLAGMLGFSQVTEMARRSWDEGFNMPRGPEREEALRNAHNLTAIQATLSANLSAITSEAGRTQQLSGELARRGIPNVTTELDLFGAKTIEEIELVGRRFMSITSPDARRQFAERGLFRKSMDVLAEAFTGSLLKGFTTHAVNIAGNTANTSLYVIDEAVGSIIGRVRSSITGNTDRATGRNALARLQGMQASLMDGIYLAGKTLYTEETLQARTKVDLSVNRAIGTTGNPSEILSMARNGNLLSAAINAYGSYIRLGTRALLAEDEFFSVVAQRGELYTQAQMQAFDVYNLNIANGKTVDEASEAAEAARLSIINNPPEEVRSVIQEQTDTMLFKNDLPGVFGKLNDVINHPALKIQIPFFRTLSNVALRGAERVVGPLYSPTFWRQVKKGGRDADIAIGKWAVGSSIAAGWGLFAAQNQDPNGDIVIIGSGPIDSNLRRAYFQENKFQPYSINFRQEDGSYKSFTFSRFDPVSAPLLIAADFAEYARYEDDPEQLERVASSVASALAQYVEENLFFTTQSQMLSALMEPNPEDAISTLSEILIKPYTQGAMGMAPGFNTFSASVEREIDPTVRDTQLPSQGLFGVRPNELPPLVRGVYAEMQRGISRNPLFSRNLPPALNNWGEEITVGEDTSWDFFSPIRIQDARYSNLNKELLSINQGVSPVPRSIEGVRLSREQRNDYILMSNQIDSQGRLPGMEGYNATDALLPQLNIMIESDFYQNQPDEESKARLIRNLISTRRAAAREMLYSKYPRLRIRIDSAQ